MRKFGQLLSAMIFQNISVIIAVGIIQGIFGIYGWWYNERILLLVDPLYNTLLPVLLGYTGGKLLGGQRGAVVASFVTYGLTLASKMPAIFGAMVVGPLVGWMIYKIDRAIKNRIPVGYELLIGNIIAAIVGVILTVVCFLYVGQTLSAGVEWSLQFLEKIVYSGWLPLAAVIIEPAKVLFFNNVINFGILGPLGIQQAKELGKSIFFLLESNPGPGLGVLIAYMLKAKLEQRKGAKLALFIHFFGGIHEVYFPYILRKPVLLIALITGGMAGIMIFQSSDVGLVSLSSPGSIFLITSLASKDDMLFVLIGILVSALLSFIISWFILDSSQDIPTEAENREKIVEFSRQITIEKLNNDNATLKKEHETFPKEIKKIVFVCEAGMGSSAMGAALLTKKLKMKNLTIEVSNSSLNEIPEQVDLIICHEQLLQHTKTVATDKLIYSLPSFTDFNMYDELIERIKG